MHQMWVTKWVEGWQARVLPASNRTSLPERFSLDLTIQNINREDADDLEMLLRMTVNTFVTDKGGLA